MLERIKVWWKQTTCDHYNAHMARWHWVHDPNSEPRHVEAEYICDNCGKKVYLHLYGKDADEFSEFAPRREY